MPFVKFWICLGVGHGDMNARQRPRKSMFLDGHVLFQPLLSFALFSFVTQFLSYHFFLLFSRFHSGRSFSGEV